MLQLIRFIGLGIYIPLAFLLGVLIALIRPRHKDNVWLTCQLLKPLAPWMGIRIQVEGKEQLKDMPSSIVISNHQDNMDMIAASFVLPRSTVSVGKSSIKFIPIFGLLYWLTGNIFIDRKKGRASMDKLKSIGPQIKEKSMNLWILPEGTRSRGRGLLPFKAGAFILSRDLDLPIQPICFSSYHKIFHWNRWKSGTIFIKVLPALSSDLFKEKDKAELKEEIARIHDHFKKELQALDQKNIR